MTHLVVYNDEVFIRLLEDCLSDWVGEALVIELILHDIWQETQYRDVSNGVACIFRLIYQSF